MNWFFVYTTHPKQNTFYLCIITGWYGWHTEQLNGKSITVVLLSYNILEKEYSDLHNVGIDFNIAMFSGWGFLFKHSLYTNICKMSVSVWKTLNIVWQKRYRITTITTQRIAKWFAFRFDEAQFFCWRKRKYLNDN